MGLFSFIGGLLGAGAQKHAVTQATDAEVGAFNKGIDEQHRQFDLTRSDFQPYLTAGTSALSGISGLVGLNGGPEQQTAIDALRQSPYYQSLYRNGQEAVLQNASATGGLRGGNTQLGLANFGADTLSQTIQQQLENLGGIAGLGEGATNQVAGFGQNKANAITALLGNIGGAQASGALAKGGLNAGMWNSAGSFADSLASAFLPGGGGGMGALKTLFGGGGGGF